LTKAGLIDSLATDFELSKR
jgi:DNA-binding protein HU-beta